MSGAASTPTSELKLSLNAFSRPKLNSAGTPGAKVTYRPIPTPPCNVRRVRGTSRRQPVRNLGQEPKLFCEEEEPGED
eukprot:3931584-Rhodomonas_salina.1